MRICIVALGIVHYYRHDALKLVGGAESQTAFLADALARAGQDVTLVVSDLGGETRLPHRALDAFQQDAGVRVLRFFHPRLSGILRALARADADLYYQRNAAMVTGVTAAFCRRHGRAFVYGAGSDTDLTFRTARLEGLRDRIFYYAGLRMAAGIVTQNRYQEALCRQSLRKPVRVISNGVDVVPEEGCKRDRVVWIGAIRRIKQPELFLELARRMPAVSFFMIGGQSPMESRFAGRVAEEAAGIPNLTLTGHLPRDEVQYHLARSFALVNTSKVEGFPNAYLEAWSHGVPVVALQDLDGLMRSEGVGWVCSSVDEMTAALRSIEGRADIASVARSLVQRRFSSEVIARQYLEFFESLPGRHAGA